MTDPKIEKLAAQVLEAISDPRVCGYGAKALRNLIKDELRRSSPADYDRASVALDQAAGAVADRVEDVCRGLPPELRAVGVVVAAAGAVYGVSQMPEAEIRKAIADMRVKVVDTKLRIAGEEVQLSMSSTLAPLFGEPPSANVEARWQQRIFGQVGTARVFAEGVGGNASAGGSWSTPMPGGNAEFGANTGNGGTVYFRLRMQW